ncbi:hypothetical protein [Bacillus sp. BP-3]|uniref:hypothetical protein n=1 Tax=Bacillus sp. BP-3 TaxID=3022773 RepID=UPI00232FCF85|nr:hypothetical protein [Bacillus sp. BP-3]MDC2863490.1 hypothetical protein [Bacillus sp. BP-3]
METKQTIQISIYNSNQDRTKQLINSGFGSYYPLSEYEFVYEAEISSVADFIALTYRFDKFVKYKKPTDKNWYNAKTMVKRLFKNEVVNNKPIIKIIEVNCWKEKREKEYQKKLAAEKRREEREALATKKYWEEFRRNPQMPEFGEDTQSYGFDRA